MISLLHVDSDIRLLMALKEYLEEENGITVETLTSASDALDLLNTRNFDVIVSEYYLPVTDGQTFLEILRDIRKNTTPFIFFAKKTTNAGMIRALNTGATFYVLKGSDPKKEFAVLKHFIMSAVQQKQVKDALVESEERYRHVVEDQSEFIMRFVPDGTLLFVNEAYCNYFHADRNEITGKNIFEIIPPKHRDDFRRHLAGLSPEHPVSTADSRYVTDDGSVRWQRWNNRALFDEQGQVTEFQSVGRDISQQKIAENALLQAHKNLGIMNSITRHDILNQLTIVLGFLELSRESGEDPTVKEYIHKAILAAETIRAQITFTRDYQDIGSSAPQWQNLEHVVRKAIKGLDMTGISLDCQLGGIWLFVDPLIEKVFYNLADNSLRHGGHVKHIRIFSEEDENGLNILYEDDGIGIPGDAKEKVFRREYFHNTGLGLYLIREICAITNISIRETGTEGKGVRFEISVPGGKFETRPLPDSS